MRELISAAAEWLRTQSQAKREELRLLELGTWARGYEEGATDTREQFGIEVQYIPVGDDDEDDDSV